MKKITVFGYTFKENCSDTRNTKVKNLLTSMIDKNIKIELWDPLIGEDDHLELNNLGVKTLKSEPKNPKIVVICVNHSLYNSFLENYKGMLYDYRYKNS